MKKIKVEDMACFEQVAKVIGKTNAKRELFIALKGYKFEKFPINTEADISGAFKWRKTVQGAPFWDSIDEGINPYNNEEE